jgi:hypothetical protein
MCAAIGIVRQKMRAALGRRHETIRVEICGGEVAGRGNAASPGSGGASPYQRRGFARVLALPRHPS